MRFDGPHALEIAAFTVGGVREERIQDPTAVALAADADRAVAAPSAADAEVAVTDARDEVALPFRACAKNLKLRAESRNFALRDT